jgi:hypothetical protein
MKTKLIVTIILAHGAYLWAADMTITIPDQDVPRVQEAYGSILNLGRNATPAEVSQAITNWLHQSTLDYERRKNTYTFTPPPMHFPTPTPTATPGLRAAETPAAKAATPTATPKKKK